MDSNPPAQPWQVATINNQWRLAHRGSKADARVLQEVFGEQCYAFLETKHGAAVSNFAEVADRHGRPLIVDCGANFGASVLFFSVHFPDAALVAIEPEHGNFELLSENIRQFPCATALEKAVASSAGTVVLRDPGDGEWAYRAGVGLDEGRELGQVETVPVRDVVASVPDAVPLILKVDIEGAEGDLFSGDTTAISEFPLVIVELHDWLLPRQGTSEPFLRWHLAGGRELVQSGENLFSYAPWIWDPRLAEARARLASAA